jgi:hypothetical protein
MKKLRGLSPRGNYADRAIDAVSAKSVVTVCCVVSATDPYGSNFDFLDRSRYFFFQVAPQLYSRG